mmetsp:Transcript_8047/g.30210  ORF Transcript_8047/g.30210 Transcript_8047/m.30210 type:complete len:131 (-) Transcript_8047:127-519(-)
MCLQEDVGGPICLLPASSMWLRWLLGDFGLHTTTQSERKAEDDASCPTEPGTSTRCIIGLENEPRSARAGSIVECVDALGGKAWNWILLLRRKRTPRKAASGIVDRRSVSDDSSPRAAVAKQTRRPEERR